MLNASSFNQAKIYSVDRSRIESLKKESLLTPRQVIRICLHSSPEAKLHEMLIVHQQDAYIKPHKHLNKTESFHVIEGELDVVIFDENGKILERVEMGDYSSGKPFCYRLSAPFFHTVVPLSEQVVFHEVTDGPFDRRETLFAEWAPDEGERELADRYVQSLKRHSK